ncbi:hypothetical protein H0H92_000646 [Tricholoma furcatifolium]|nr:hypothetical protein H0H92_000646 [Tricholoma furcatifolium]
MSEGSISSEQIQKLTHDDLLSNPHYVKALQDVEYYRQLCIRSLRDEVLDTDSNESDLSSLFDVPPIRRIRITREGRRLVYRFTGQLPETE